MIHAVAIPLSVLTVANLKLRTQCFFVLQRENRCVWVPSTPFSSLLLEPKDRRSKRVNELKEMLRQDHLRRCLAASNEVVMFYRVPRLIKQFGLCAKKKAMRYEATLRYS